jgi:Rab9 effector protein with kelch motifs
MALPDGQHRNLTKDGIRRAQSAHGSPVPLRDVTLPGGGDGRPLTPPVPSGTSIPSARSESLPSPYPSGSNSSLSASTTTLRATNSSRTQRAQSSSRRSTPADSPTNGTPGRRLPTPNANASSTSLSAAAAAAGATKSPRVPVTDPPPRFRAIPHLPNVANVEPAPPPVMYWSKAPVWGTLPTHGFRAHTVTLVDNVAWIFGGCDEKGCFKDMWCFNTGACALHPSLLPVVGDRMG